VEKRPGDRFRTGKNLEYAVVGESSATDTGDSERVASDFGGDANGDEGSESNDEVSDSTEGRCGERGGIGGQSGELQCGGRGCGRASCS
jgi:hypothetical protein